MGLLYNCQMKILKPDCTVEDDYLKIKQCWVNKKDVKKRKNVLSQNKHRINNELSIYLHINTK